jgi:ketosteroid isomerase-like protein
MTNASVIEAVYAAFAKRDIPAVLALFHDDVVWVAANHSPLADESPYEGKGRVRDGVFSRMGERFTRFSVRVSELFEARGGRVVMLGLYEGLFRDGKTPIDAEVAHVWTLVDGRVTKFQQYTDTFQLSVAAR